MRFLASTRSLAGTSLSRSGSWLLDEASAELMILFKFSLMTCVQRCMESGTVCEPAPLLPRAAPSGSVEAMLHNECWVRVCV